MDLIHKTDKPCCQLSLPSVDHSRRMPSLKSPLLGTLGFPLANSIKAYECVQQQGRCHPWNQISIWANKARESEYVGGWIYGESYDAKRQASPEGRWAWKKITDPQIIFHAMPKNIIKNTSCNSLFSSKKKRLNKCFLIILKRNFKFKSNKLLSLNSYLVLKPDLIWNLQRRLARGRVCIQIGQSVMRIAFTGA